MPKAVLVRIPTHMLQTLLGLTLPSQTQIVHAAVRYERYACPTLELVLEGEHLPQVFTVEAGWPLQEGQIIVQHHQVETRIEPLR